MSDLEIPRSELVKLVAQCRPVTLGSFAHVDDGSREDARGSHDCEGNDCLSCASTSDTQHTTNDRCSSAKDNRGRPKFYQPDNLMMVWLYVQVMKARTGWRVSKICSQRGAGLKWVRAGQGIIDKKTLEDHAYFQANDQTLRRRYYEAVELLTGEGSSLRELRKMITSSKVLPMVSPTEEYWRRVLCELLDQSNKIGKAA